MGNTRGKTITGKEVNNCMRHRIGGEYGAVIHDRDYRVTLVSVDKTKRPHRGQVIIRDHTVNSFTNGSEEERRQGSEAVPVTRVNLRDLLP